MPKSHDGLARGGLASPVPLVALLIISCATAYGEHWNPKAAGVQSGATPLELESELLTESSGVAFSNLDRSCVWSHNDSGGRARLFAFTHSGRNCGRVLLEGVKALDWEDMTSFVDGRPRLLVADVGDNDSKRDSVLLYLFDEPNPREHSRIKSFQRLVVRYANGPQNCESVAVDTKNRRILLLGKAALIVTMHEIELPPVPVRTADAPSVTTIECLAKPVAAVAIPLATGMDLCKSSGDLWISSYHYAYRFPSKGDDSLRVRLRQVPEMVELPKLKQVEAITTDEKGRVWVTSEGSPAKMQRVLPKD